MSFPLISVIIPSHNSAKSVGNAIQSMIDQTYRNLEILVVDDNSTDDTEKIVSEFIKKDTRVRYIKLDVEDPNRFDKTLNRNINAGYSCRNFGFNHIKGKLVTFQDADDVSLLNRIEIQFELFKKYDAIHLSVNWIPYQQEFVGKKLNFELYSKNSDIKKYGPDELCTLARKSKGILIKIFPRAHAHIPFRIKRMRIIHRLFFGSYASYPGAGNSPLFKREVLDKVRFRPLAERVWPTYMGRGADRDFNLNVALTFKKSYVIMVPLYLWNNRSLKKTENIASYIKDAIIS